MNKPPNPITQGLRTVSRDPLIFMLEILWRWLFGLLTGLLVFGVGIILLGPLPIGNRWAATWNSHDPQIIGSFLVAIILLLGSKLIVAAALLPIAIALMWAILSSAGRGITVKRLRAGMPSLRFRSIMALQFLRSFLTWFCFVLLIAAIVGEALIATRGPKPDLVQYYLMASPSIIFISGFWVVMNWYLSLAAIFGLEGQTFRGALRQTRQIVARQRSDFAGTGFVFLLFRILLLVVALAICGLFSRSAGTAPQSYVTLVTVVALSYFAISDFLYMARMAAYLALASAHVEPGGPKLVITAETLPAEKTSTS
jgi:hypothetical protein